MTMMITMTMMTVMLDTMMTMMMVAVVGIVLPRPWLESEEAFAKRLHLTFTQQLQMEQQLMPTVPMMRLMMMIVTHHIPTSHIPTRWGYVTLMKGGHLTESYSHHIQ